MMIVDNVVTPISLGAVAKPVLPVQLPLLLQVVTGEVPVVDVKLHKVLRSVPKLSLILNQVHPLEHLLIFECMIHRIIKSSGSVLHGRRLFLFAKKRLFLVVALICNLHAAFLVLNNKLLREGMKPIF
jgi:hypothetical protein